MNSTQSHRESLIATYIKRAYWAVNSIHNKVFFNQANETYITPDREDEIVAMLTEQNPIEVALLRTTRELIERAEREQPDKKFNIIKQDKNIMMEEPMLEQIIEKKEDKRVGINEKEIQDNTVIIQGKVSIEVGQDNNSIKEGRSATQKREIREQTEEQEEKDVEMNGKESRQNSTIEEKK